MTFNFRPAFTLPALALTTAALLGGCATMSSTPEQVVKLRAAQQWKARVANNFDSTYTFTPPSYRALTSLEAYKKGFGPAVAIKSAEVADVKCETEDKCTTQVKVEAQPLLPLARRKVPPITTYIDETWIREDGQWWLFPTP